MRYHADDRCSQSAKVAKQLSRIDFGLFQKVTPTEFDSTCYLCSWVCSLRVVSHCNTTTELAFSKDCREIMSPNIKAMADRFNQVGLFNLACV
jgi:hypothetical protein